MRAGAASMMVARRRSGLPGPLDIAAHRLWIDASVGITLVGSDVDGVADQSGNGNNLAPPASGNRPLYLPTGGPDGGPCIQFASGEHLRKTSFSGGGAFGTMTYWCVYLAENTGTRVIMDYQATSRFALLCNTSHMMQAFSAGSSNVFSTGTTAANTVWRLWIGQATDGGNQSIARGVTAEDTDSEGWAAGGPADGGTLFVGCDIASGSSGIGRVAEMGVCKGLDSTQRQALVDYVAARYPSGTWT